MTKIVNTDLISGFIGLFIAVVLFFAMEDISRLSIMFPETMIYITAIISSSLIVKGFIAPQRAAIFNVGSNTRWLITGLLFFMWIISMPWLGFLISTVVSFSLIVCYLASARTRVTGRKILMWLPIVIAETAFFYLIFTRLLHVPLPECVFL